MRNRGWAGRGPTSDQEAIDRILDAAEQIGEPVRIADLARMLGVTRQTVYRHFPNAEAVVVAGAMRAADGFIDRLAGHVGGLTDPVAALVESVSYAVEQLGGDTAFGRLLTSRGDDGTEVTSLTSDTALTFAHSILHRFDVDWHSHGFDDGALDELAELCLRTMHSLLVDPGAPARSGPELRRFVARWLGPAVCYPRWAEVVSAIGTS
ncbi:TetR/AcrR family transcriptional regulator [Mycobacterium sp. SMC-4]|uniref:TetR/AcrR family transcriptional regulator n=1 Tax=Mycobacterium sp. SMC-4 TaxID=2857059 RepID=UPI0021B22E18|nr:TetR/AcrR family transcriptional regulator [Mycobacterium sp. SMC-4]UXA18414.1 TetR/AcrR family transcriptional regulator [Mycobacterium sp. SMC-4]